MKAQSATQSALRRLRTVLSVRGCRIVLVLFLCGRIHAGDPAADYADQLFLQQLTERSFFNLAEHHCRRQKDRATLVDDKANWQLRLSQVYEQHAWFESSANRTGFLNLAVEEITEFLKEESPAPELQFRLRIQQARILGQGIRIRLLLGEAGHLFGRNTRKHAGKWTTLVRRESLKSTITVIDKSIELMESLQRQLEQLRRDMDVRLVREIRDLARLEAAELRVLKWRTLKAVGSAAADEVFVATEESVQMAVKSIRSGTERVRVKCLLAELPLTAGDQEEFLLQVRGINTGDSERAVFLPQFLMARSLLFDQEATQALQLLDKTAARTSLQRQHLDWLRLEALLGVRELVGHLGDSKLIRESQADFAAQSEIILKSARGVFLEAAERTSRRFSLIDEVGVEVADLVELVEQQRGSDNVNEALRLIEQTLQRLPHGASPRARAALLLRSAELFVTKQNWAQADSRLLKAIGLFSEAGMKRETAVADLLRIYVIAQQPNSSREADYVTALENHLERYPLQPTAKQARQWLLSCVESADPIHATSLSLKLFENESNPQKQIARLEEAGRLLNSIQDISTSVATELAARFKAHVDALSQEPDRYPASDMTIVMLYQLELEFRESAATGKNWKYLEKALAKLNREMTSSTGKHSLNHQAAVQRMRLMRAIATSRLASDPKALAPLEKEIQSTPTDQLQQTIEFLYAQYADEPKQIGDVWVARNNERLLNRLFENGLGTRSFDDKLRLLQIVRRTAYVNQNDQVSDGYLDKLLQQPLSSGQLTAIGDLLSKTGQFGRPSKPGTGQSLKKFWNRVAIMQQQGSNLWLEAQLQLALAAFAGGDAAEARKRLGVTETLYPGWGTDERLERAERLAKSLAD